MKRLYHAPHSLRHFFIRTIFYTICITAISLNVNAITRYVSPSGTHVSPFTSWATAATNIQAAVDAASDGDSVLVADGTYDNGGAVTPAWPHVSINRVMINKSITVQSVNGPAITIITGNGIVRCAYVGSNAVLSGFTLRNGRTNPMGSGIDPNGGGAIINNTAIITNCIVQNNSGGRGGGLYLYYPAPKCVDCIVENNSAGYGGGVFNYFEGTISDCIIRGNDGEYGGGVNIQNGLLANCTISNNYASWHGGGVHVSKAHSTYNTRVSNCFIRANTAAINGGGLYGSARPLVMNCYVSDNIATNGGGIASYQGINAINCVSYRNHALNLGGGMYCKETQSQIINCTIAQNTADNQGGGVYSEAYNYFKNTIIYFNAAPVDSNLYYIVPLYDMFFNCCITPTPAKSTANISANPRFVNAAGNNFRLLITSPCINTGDNSYISYPYDLDGNPRIEGGIVDIGAYEWKVPYDPVSPVITSIAPPSWSSTNIPVMDMSITATDDFLVTEVTINGSKASYDQDNTWLYSLPLAIGTNTAEVIAADIGLNTATATVMYVRSWDSSKTNPPVITAVAPETGFTSLVSTVTMTIDVAADIGVSNVLVNTHPASFLSGYSWQYDLHLAQGHNDVTINAVDFGGNAATEQVYYVYAPTGTVIETGAPVIVSVDPPDGTQSSDWLIDMTIAATDNVAVTAVTVNGRQATHAAYPNWSITVPIIPGQNPKTIIATDDEGYATTQQVSYTGTMSGGQPNTHYVSPSGLHISPFTTWENAATNIQAAVNVAAAGKTVMVAPSLYDEGCYSTGSSLSNRVMISQAIHMTSVAGPKFTVICGSGSRSTGAVRNIFCDVAALISGFTLSNGNTLLSGSAYEISGGGAYLEFGATLSNCIVTSCSAFQGGAVYCGEDALVTDSILIHNYAKQQGGAVFTVNRGTVFNCSIYTNKANSYGGGIYCDHDGDIILCNIYDNYGGFGGGVYCFDGGTVNRCRIYDNSAHQGGGLYMYADCGVYNSLIYDNSAANTGGGVYANIGTSFIKIYNCTICGNYSQIGGGGIIYGGSAVSVYNSIVYYNTSPNTGSENYSMGYFYNSCTYPMPTMGANNIDSSPRFLSNPDYAYHLRTDSPCIDAGTNQFTFGAWDLAGNTRIHDGTVDMGAIEYIPEPATLFAALFTLIVLKYRAAQR